MKRCARCGTLNDDSAVACSSCGALLESPAEREKAASDRPPETPVSPEKGPPERSRRDPFAELASLPRPVLDPSSERLPTPIRPREPAPEAEPPGESEQLVVEELMLLPVIGAHPVVEPSVHVIPEWVLPPSLGRRADDARAAPLPQRRGLRFGVLLLVWIAIFQALPLWVVWSTSPFLREVGPDEYVRALPTCEESARASGEDPSLCSVPAFRASFTETTSAIVSERRRVLAFLGVAEAAAALALLVLLVGVGLSGWWALLTPVSPAGLVIAGWALWRLSALPARYWETRRA